MLQQGIVRVQTKFDNVRLDGGKGRGILPKAAYESCAAMEHHVPLPLACQRHILFHSRFQCGFPCRRCGEINPILAARGRAADRGASSAPLIAMHPNQLRHNVLGSHAGVIRHVPL